MRWNLSTALQDKNIAKHCNKKHYNEESINVKRYDNSILHRSQNIALYANWMHNFLP